VIVPARKRERTTAEATEARNTRKIVSRIS